MAEGWQAWTCLAMIFGMLICLVLEAGPPDMIMMGTLICFIPLGILNVEQALHGFSDNAMLSIGVLFIVAKGIEMSGGLEYVSKIMFKTKSQPDPKSGEVAKGQSLVWVLMKFMIPVAVFSAFLANIPLVAMMIPPVADYARRLNMAPSKVLLPLSYAALYGGTWTLIGASTNLVVYSLANRAVPEMKMNLFELGIVGIPVTLAGILYIVALGGKLLPDRLAMSSSTINAREYNVVLEIKPKCSFCRKTIEQSGIRRQPGLSLVQVERDGFPIPSPGADFVLLPRDRLHFSGVIDSILSLTQLDGLTLSEEEGGDSIDLNKLRPDDVLVEAVVASRSPMVDKTIRDLQFRTRYNAIIIAVHRHGTRINSGIGDIVLDAGDSLLMVASSGFVAKHRNNSTFALVSQLTGFTPIQRKKAPYAALFVLLLVIFSAVGYPLITCGLFSVAAMLITRCLTVREARESMELGVLIMIASAFGISEALVQSGASHLVAKAMMSMASPFGSVGLIAATYIATTVFSCAITNSAAVTIMFPVALSAAQLNGLDFRPFAYILMMASSASFMTPTGCPTNLMVYTPGGYKFMDYVVFGGPLQLWLLFITVGVTVTLDYWYIWWAVLIIGTCVLTPLLAKQSCNFPKQGRIMSDTDANSEGGKAFSTSDDEPMKAQKENGSSMITMSSLPTSSMAGNSVHIAMSGGFSVVKAPAEIQTSTSRRNSLSMEKKLLEDPGFSEVQM